MKTDTRPALLDKCRSIAEKAKREGRGLTASEQTEIDSKLDEVRGLNARAESERLDAADAASKKILGQLDAMASGRIDNDDSRRLVFTKGMAEAAAAKIMPSASYAEKALAPSGSVVIPQQFSTDPIPLGKPSTDLLSILPVVVQPSASFAWLKQTVRTNNAQIVPEGQQKPQSVFSVVKVEDTLKVVAHLSDPIPRYWFVDVPQLQVFLTNEMTFGLQQAVESLALATVAATSGIQAQAFSTSVLQTLLKSVTRIEGNGYGTPSAFVLHPNDFELIQLQLLTTPAVEYQGAAVFEPLSRKLWGIPLCLTVAATAGTAYTFAPGSVGLNTDSAGVQVAWSETSNSDDWSKNLIRCRTEGRYQAAVYQPLGVVKSTLTA